MAALAVAVMVLLAYVVAGTTGLAKQFADPTIQYKYNVSVIALAAPSCFIFGWLMLPELRRDHRERLAVAAITALFATSICTAATAVLTPSIARPTDTVAFAAAAYVQFAAFGFLPTFTATRVYVCLNRDTWTDRAGDHYLDISKLSPEAVRLLAKHTNGTMKPPPAWRRMMLFGNRNGITHQDLQRCLRLEQAEERQLAELYRQKTPNVEALAAYESQALKDHRARVEREVTALRAEGQRLQAAYTAAEAELRTKLDQAVAAKQEAFREAAERSAEAAHAVALHSEEIRKLHADLRAAEETSTYWRSAAQAAQEKNDELGRILATAEANAAARVSALTKDVAAAQAQKDAALQDLARERHERDQDTCAALERTLALLDMIDRRDRRIMQLVREQDELQATSAAQLALLERMVAAHERDIGRLEAERDNPVQRSIPPTASRARRPRPTPEAPSTTHWSRDESLSRRPLPPTRALLRKNPLRQGLPQRKWRRFQLARLHEEHAHVQV